MLFLWLKTLHIFFVIAWFAGIFYLPRLYVYHAEATDEPASNERFKIMERKLYYGIMTPSMVLTVLFGVWMMLELGLDYYLSQGWMHAKLTLVAFLLIYHFHSGHLMKVFKEDRNTRSHVFYRFYNEVPVFILLPVLIFVVVRPF